VDPVTAARDEIGGLMGGSRNIVVLLLALGILGAILALLYRSTSDEDLSEDEWLDFEHP